MKLIKIAFAGMLAVAGIFIATSDSRAAPLSFDVTVMKFTLDDNAVQVRYGWGYRGGWHGGYRGPAYGYRGYGYQRWGAGAVAAGAIVGSAIASSSYYNGHPYYGGGVAYGDDYPAYAPEYASNYCPPAYGDFAYGGYYARPGYYSGW